MRKLFTLSVKEGAGKAGCALHPGLVRKMDIEKNAHEHTGQRRAIRAFPAQWFTAYSASPGEPSSFATVFADLSQSFSASVGRQDHTTSPSLESRSSVATFTSTASHRTFGDDSRSAPLSVRRAESKQ